MWTGTRPTRCWSGDSAHCWPASCCSPLRRRGGAGLWPGTLGYGAVVAFAGLYALQFVESPALDMLILLTVLTLALLIAAIFWGLKSGNRGAVWLGYSGFS